MSDEPAGDNDDGLVTDSTQQPGSDDATSAKGRETKERRLRRERQEAERFWREVFGSEIGRREMWRLLAGNDGAHVFETRFMSGPNGMPDPYASWYARGEQDFGLRLYHAWLRNNHLGVALMHAENDPRFTVVRRRKASE